MSYKFKDLGRKVLITWELPESSEHFVLWDKYRPLSVMVEGEFAGGRVDILGTNSVDEPANFYLLNDPQGNPLSFFKSKIEQILEDCVQIKPGANAIGKVTVYLLLTRNG